MFLQSLIMSTSLLFRKVLWFSMDWGDYGRVVLAIAFTIIWAAFTFALINLVWLNGPWDSIRLILGILVCSEVVIAAAY